MGYVPQVWWCGGSALFSLVLLLSPQMHQYSMGPHGCVAGLPAMEAGLNLGIAYRSPWTPKVPTVHLVVSIKDVAFDSNNYLNA